MVNRIEKAYCEAEFKKENPIGYNCLKRFLASRKVEKLLGNFNLDHRMIIQIVRSYADYLQIPKDWERYTPPMEEKPSKTCHDDKYSKMQNKMLAEEETILTKVMDSRGEGNKTI